MNKDTRELINKLTPSYNSYRKNKNKFCATDLLKIIWEVGDILNNFIDNSKIRPHTLFRKIYGKAEGSENIAQNSFITRDFQSRAYRIRNIFKDKKSIDKLFPSLSSFSAFREAMPFFDNKKYLLKGKEKANLIDLLNSAHSNTYIKGKILEKQKKKIGSSNNRKQKLPEIIEDKKIFIEFYNFVYNLSKKDNKEIIAFLKSKNITKEILIKLSKNTDSLCQDNFQFEDFVTYQVNDNLWASYQSLIKKAISQKNAMFERRLRRVIPVEKISNLASMLFSLTKNKP